MRQKRKIWWCISTALMLVLGAQAAVTIDFEPSGEFTNNFNGGVYNETASGGLNGTVGLVSSNSLVANFDGPQSEALTISENGDAFTVGLFLNFSSFGSAAPGDQVIRIGVTSGGDADYTRYSWAALETVDAASGTHRLQFRDQSAITDEFSLSLGEWYYFEATLSLDADDQQDIQMSINNASSSGTIGSLISYYSEKMARPGFLSGETVYGAFKGHTAFDSGASAVLDNFYVSNQGVSQSASSLALTEAEEIGEVFLDWTAVAGADSYKVFRSLQYGSGFSEITTTDLTNYADSGLSNYINYYYYVEALSGGVVLAKSPVVKSFLMEASDTTPPAAPAGLMVVENVQEIGLLWSSNAEVDLQEGPYTVYRSGVSGEGYEAIASNVVLNSYVDTGVAVGEAYYYVVSATDYAGNESAFSDEVSATVDGVVANGTIDIIGNTDGSLGGEFTDYSALNGGDLWADSFDYDGVVRLSASLTGFNGERSASRWNNSNYQGPGSEIDFTKGSGTAATATDALAEKTFIALKLDSSEFDSEFFVLNSLSVSMWRNGGQAADVYQFAYDADGDGYDVDDMVGTAVHNAASGTASTFAVTEEFSTAASTNQEIRLYFWKSDGGGAVAANTHLFEITATYNTNIPYSYTQWASQFGGLEAIGSESTDFDGDGVSNLGEYALNGNPTNAAEKGQVAFSSDGITFTYVHAKVADDTNLVYRLLDTTDLVSGVQNTNTYSSQVLGPTDDNYQMVTNFYNMTSDEFFVELEVEQP